MPPTLPTWDPAGGRLASGAADGSVRVWDLRPFPLLANGPAPSPRAALISQTLKRLWCYRRSGLDFVPERWKHLGARDGYHLDQVFEIDLRPPHADPSAEPVLLRFDIRPLLDPPPPGKNKLDQLLDWLAEQEEREPRLRPGYEPPTASRD